MKRRKNKPPTKSAVDYIELLYNKYAVSYTHLDVYKRQVRVCPQNASPPETLSTKQVSLLLDTFLLSLITKQ